VPRNALREKSLKAQLNGLFTADVSAPRIAMVAIPGNSYIFRREEIA
jgi:hypothetical protein